jgi:hypothetical protein
MPVDLSVGARPTDGELPRSAVHAAAGGDVLEQLVGESGPVQADQDLAPVGAGDRCGQGGDVVGGVVAGGVAGPGIDHQDVIDVVADHQVRYEAGTTLVL